MSNRNSQPRRGRGINRGGVNRRGVYQQQTLPFPLPVPEPPQENQKPGRGPELGGDRAPTNRDLSANQIAENKIQTKTQKHISKYGQVLTFIPTQLVLPISTIGYYDILLHEIELIDKNYKHGGFTLSLEFAEGYLRLMTLLLIKRMNAIAIVKLFELSAEEEQMAKTLKNIGSLAHMYLQQVGRVTHDSVVYSPYPCVIRFGTELRIIRIEEGLISVQSLDLGTGDVENVPTVAGLIPYPDWLPTGEQISMVTYVISDLSRKHQILFKHIENDAIHDGDKSMFINCDSTRSWSSLSMSNDEWINGTALKFGYFDGHGMAWFRTKYEQGSHKSILNPAIAYDHFYRNVLPHM